MMKKVAESIAEVIESGLCIGCGLCEAIAQHPVKMQLTKAGSLRPAPLDRFSTAEEKLLLSVCPGIQVTPRQQLDDPACVDEVSMDDVWGQYASMCFAWAADPDIRFKSSTGGVLTALGRHLLVSNQVAFVYQVKANPQAPVQSISTISETADDVVSASGSRYGPVAPLTDFLSALDRNEPFAVIAKPCDLTAIHNLAAHDSRVDNLVTHRLTMVCGGQSTAQKSREVLSQAGIDEHKVTLYRHRGYGNPGPTRVESHGRKALEISYQELWKDESSWGIESRCKLCPDALGEASDIAAADVWPGGTPTGEDEGFNGIVTRSDAGEQLIASAVASGELVIGDKIPLEQFNDFQPHQVRKKMTLQARYQGLNDVGFPIINAPLSRLDLLAERLPPEGREHERKGAATRFGKRPG